LHSGQTCVQVEGGVGPAILVFEYAGTRLSCVLYFCGTGFVTGTSMVPRQADILCVYLALVSIHLVSVLLSLNARDVQYRNFRWLRKSEPLIWSISL